MEASRTLIVAKGVAHVFSNTGARRLKQVDIYLRPGFVTKGLK